MILISSHRLCSIVRGKFVWRYSVFRSIARLFVQMHNLSTLCTQCIGIMYTHIQSNKPRKSVNVCRIRPNIQVSISCLTSVHSQLDLLLRLNTHFFLSTVTLVVTYKHGHISLYFKIQRKQTSSPSAYVFWLLNNNTVNGSNNTDKWMVERKHDAFL